MKCNGCYHHHDPFCERCDDKIECRRLNIKLLLESQGGERMKSKKVKKEAEFNLDGVLESINDAESRIDTLMSLSAIELKKVATKLKVDLSDLDDEDTNSMVLAIDDFFVKKSKKEASIAKAPVKRKVSKKVEPEDEDEDEESEEEDEDSEDSEETEDEESEEEDSKKDSEDEDSEEDDSEEDSDGDGDDADEDEESGSVQMKDALLVMINRVMPEMDFDDVSEVHNQIEVIMADFNETEDEDSEDSEETEDDDSEEEEVEIPAFVDELAKKYKCTLTALEDGKIVIKFAKKTVSVLIPKDDGDFYLTFDDAETGDFKGSKQLPAHKNNPAIIASDKRARSYLDRHLIETTI